MCLLVFAFRADPRYALVLAANRDESHSRATRPAGFWDDSPNLLAGKDLQAGGTWLGITTTGRFASITNFRRGARPMNNKRSRGALVKDYLTGKQPPRKYLQMIYAQKDDFAPFNLLVGNPDELWYFSNQRSDCHALSLAPGIFGLSNGALDDPWPKVRKSKARLKQALDEADSSEKQCELQCKKNSKKLGKKLINMLSDQSSAWRSELPDTGVGEEKELKLAPVFIAQPDYGTRASTALIIETNGKVTFREDNFNNIYKRTLSAQFSFSINSSEF